MTALTGVYTRAEGYKKQKMKVCFILFRLNFDYTITPFINTKPVLSVFSLHLFSIQLVYLMCFTFRFFERLFIVLCDVFMAPSPTPSPSSQHA